MVAVAELSRELAAHVDDPDPGSDASLLLNCGFGPDRWFEYLVAEDGNRIVGFLYSAVDLKPIRARSAHGWAICVLPEINVATV
jgi:hypothetical protein